MTQAAELEHPQVLAKNRSFGACSPSPCIAGLLVGASRSMARSEARDCLSASLWLTSLHRPGVSEAVTVEDVSRSVMKIVTQELWQPAGTVQLSYPAGFWVT